MPKRCARHRWRFWTMPTCTLRAPRTGRPSRWWERRAGDLFLRVSNQYRRLTPAQDDKKKNTGSKVMLRPWLSFLLIGAICSGCATTQNLAAADRQKLKSIAISPDVKKADTMYYSGPENWAPG